MCQPTSEDIKLYIIIITNSYSELRSCVKALDSPSLILSLMVSVDVKQQLRSCVKVEVADRPGLAPRP